MATTLRTTITILLLGVTSIAFTQSEKTLVKSFPLEASQTVSLDLPGAIKVKTWDGDLLRIQMTITLQNGNEAVLKSLISAGRYNLIAKVNGSTMNVTAPSLAREVQIGGKALGDNVTFLVFAPKNISVKLPTSTSTTLRNTEGGSSL